jgi:hypothetical protein
MQLAHIQHVENGRVLRVEQFMDVMQILLAVFGILEAFIPGREHNGHI